MKRLLYAFVLISISGFLSVSCTDHSISPSVTAGEDDDPPIITGSTQTDDGDCCDEGEDDDPPIDTDPDN